MNTAGLSFREDIRIILKKKIYPFFLSIGLTPISGNYIKTLSLNSY